MKNNQKVSLLMRSLYFTEENSGLDMIYFGYNDSLFYSISMMSPIKDQRPDPDTNPDMDCMGYSADYKYAYDPRCRPWYIDTKETDVILVLKPYIFFNDNYVGLSICGRVFDKDYYGENDDFLTIMCEDFNQTKFYKYFQKQNSSSDVRYYQTIFYDDDDDDTLVFYSLTNAFPDDSSLYDIIMTDETEKQKLKEKIEVCKNIIKDPTITSYQQLQDYFDSDSNNFLFAIDGKQMRGVVFPVIVQTPYQINNKTTFVDKNLFVFTYQEDSSETIDLIMSSNTMAYMIFIIYPIIVATFTFVIIQKQLSRFLHNQINKPIVQTTNYIQNIGEALQEIKTFVQRNKSSASSQFILGYQQNKKQEKQEDCHDINQFKIFEEISTVIETLETMGKLLDIMYSKYESYDIDSQNRIFLDSIQLFKKIENIQGQDVCYVNLAKNYFILKNYQQSKYFSQLALLSSLNQLKQLELLTDKNQLFEVNFSPWGKQSSSQNYKRTPFNSQSFSIHHQKLERQNQNMKESKIIVKEKEKEKELNSKSLLGQSIKSNIKKLEGLKTAFVNKQIRHYLNRIYLHAVAIRGFQQSQLKPNNDQLKQAIKYLKQINLTNQNENILCLDELLFLYIELLSLYIHLKKQEKIQKFFNLIAICFISDKTRVRKNLIEPNNLHIIFQFYLYYMGIQNLKNHRPQDAAYCFTKIFEECKFCVKEVFEKSAFHLQEIFRSHKLDTKSLNTVYKYYSIQQQFDIYFVLECQDKKNKKFQINQQNLLNGLSQKEQRFQQLDDEQVKELINSIFNLIYTPKDRVGILLYHQFLIEGAQLDFITNEVKWKCYLQQMSKKQNTVDTDIRDWMQALHSSIDYLLQQQAQHLQCLNKKSGRSQVIFLQNSSIAQPISSCLLKILQQHTNKLQQKLTIINYNANYPSVQITSPALRVGKFINYFYVNNLEDIASIIKSLRIVQPPNQMPFHAII